MLSNQFNYQDDHDFGLMCGEKSTSYLYLGIFVWNVKWGQSWKFKTMSSWVDLESLGDYV